MIILYHDGSKALKYEDVKTKTIFDCSEINIQKCLFLIAKEFPNSLLIWCNECLRDVINKDFLPEIFHHQLILSSYSVSGEYIISKDIGFVDQHCFINVKRDVNYPTWLMSSDIGGIFANVLLKLNPYLNKKESFDEVLCTIAKIGMANGLICYSEPRLLKKITCKGELKFTPSNLTLFKFVKQHYKFQWIFLLFINQIIYNNNFYMIAFLKSIFVKRNNLYKIDLEDINVKSTKKTIQKEEFKVDVLIPTLGRKEHLYNVLKDLSQQTILPKKVIIVEQNAIEGTTSELGYLKDSWPFEIDHTFTHQLGACNARNIALSKISGNWVFFADDDVRFDRFLLEKSYNKINK